MPLLLGIFLVLAMLPGPAFGAARAAAVMDDGYAGKVMQKILPSRTALPDKGAEIRLSLDGEGKYAQCRTIRGDGASLCQSAKAVGSFGTPPYGVPTDILIVVMGADSPKQATKTETAKEPAGGNEKYFSRIRRDLRNSMYIPEKTKPGTYHATVRLKCDKTGKILDSSIVKSSGDTLLDRYVMQGINRAGKVETPPANLQMPFDLTFTLVR